MERFNSWQTEYQRAFQWPRPIAQTLAEAGVKIGNKEDIAIQSDVPVEDSSIQTNEGSHVEPRQATVIPLHDEPSEESEIIPPPKKPDIKGKGKLSKIETKEVDKMKPKKKTASMLSYGWGNSHPATPKNFMKTFNVTVPKDQIFPSTLERIARGKSYDAKARAEDKKSGQTSKASDYKILEEAALRNYVEAKKKLQQIQSMYQSEYKREFLNWTESTAHIQIAAGLPSDKKDGLDGNQNNSPSRSQSPSKRNAWGDTHPEKRDVSSSPIRQSPTKGSDVGSFSTRDQSISPIKTHIRDNSTSPKEKSPGTENASRHRKEESVPLAVQNLPAAGVSEEKSHAYKEKRHFPEKKAQLQQLWFDMDKEGVTFEIETTSHDNDETEASSDKDSKKSSPKVEPPTSFKQAQDLLNRAHERSQKLEQDIKVDNIDS